MTLKQFYTEVSRRTDTAGTSINVAETGRVLSEAFVMLSAMTPVEASDLIAKGLAAGSKKAVKKTPPKKKK